MNARNPRFTPVPNTTINEAIEKLRSLHDSTESLLLVSKLNGLTSRTLCAASLNAIRRHSDEVLDFAENLELLLDPRTRESLDRARQEHIDGSTVDFDSLLRQ
jgi:hypothetical protein